MDVDTRLLRYFAAVAEEGNLTRAAERLFVSQPALTKQIRQLESQLGVPLFTRSRAGMTLTAAGRALADRIPAVLGELDQALREAKAAGAVTETGQPDDWLTAIANGDGVALAPESAARYYARLPHCPPAPLPLVSLSERTVVPAPSLLRAGRAITLVPAPC
jgi:DNA-binding transcriptional LysR family regulator